jgi:hypothetical protein
MAGENELTAYCGLYCKDCIRYRSRAADLARQILDELKNTQLDKYASIKCSEQKQLNPVKQFGHFRECCEVLEAIAALQCNRPCRTGGGCPTFSCEILECCQKNGLEGCWRCSKFENCEKLAMLNSIYGDSTRQNLKLIREHGIDNWAKHRNKPYIWQE